MESTRRSFLKGLSLATAGLILLPDDLPRRLWALGTPLRLWGDGIHDDAPALQAIFDGRIREVAGAERWVAVSPGLIGIRQGLFRVEKTLVMDSNTHIEGSRFEGPIDPFIQMKPSANYSSVRYSIFQYKRD